MEECMEKFECLELNQKKLYSDGYFSGDYNQEVYLKITVPDLSQRPRFYLSVYGKVNGTFVQQGYIYFYLDFVTKTSTFIGVYVKPEYRNLNIGSFLCACWIDFCFNYGYDFLNANKKQRKPFLLYMLKTYGFEVLDPSLYLTRKDVISICRDSDSDKKRKVLFFKDFSHEKIFMNTNVYKMEDYEIVHSLDHFEVLDSVLLPFQNLQKNQVQYHLLNQHQAQERTQAVLARHKK